MEVCKLLLEVGANHNQKDSFDRVALHYAAENGFFKICRMLLSKECDIDAVDNLGMASLYCAAQNQSIRIFELLKRSGANIL